MFTHSPEDFSWPEGLQKRRVPEKAFTRAYAKCTDVERSWVKKNIAQLYALYPVQPSERMNVTCFSSSGFQFRSAIRPRDWAIILLDNSCSGPAQLAAAVLPALTSGVTDILPVFSQKAVAPSLLVTLELCGLDTACISSRNSIPRLLKKLGTSFQQGIVLDLRGLPGLLSSDGTLQNNMTVWQAAPVSLMAIFSDSVSQWDWQALAWNHPHLAFEAWGKLPAILPAGMTRRTGDWPTFCASGYRVMGIPADMAHELPSFCPADLLITPGQEGCWHWPTLHRNFFQVRQVVLESNAENARKHGIGEFHPSQE